MENKEFLEKLASLMETNQKDLMVKTYSKEVINPKKTIVEIFKTNNSDDFLPFQLETKATEMGKDDFFSNIAKDVGAKKIYNLSLELDYRIFPLEKGTEQYLDARDYLVKEQDAESIVNLLNSNNIYACKIDQGQPSEPIIDNVQIIPFVFLLSTALLYLFFKNKEFVVKKSHGFSSYNIIMEEISHSAVAFALLLLMVALLTLVAGSIAINFGTAFYFIKYSAFNLIITLLLVILGFSLCCILYIPTVQNYSASKGKSSIKEVFAITAITKLVVFVLLFSLLMESVPYFFYLSKKLDDFNRVSQRLVDYVGYHSSGLKGSIVWEEEGDFAGFYEETVDKFDGLMAEYISYIQDSSGTGRLTISKHYLDFNPIKKPDGENVSVDDFIKNKHNILVSDKFDLKTVLHNEISDLKRSAEHEGLKMTLVEEDINVIFYKSDNTFQLINYHSLGEHGNVVQNPKVMLNERDYRNFQYSGTYYLAGLFYLKIDGQDKFSEIKPYIEKYGLEDIIIDVHGVNEMFSEGLARLRNIISKLMVQSIFYSIVLLILAYFSSQIYSSIFLKSITLKRIHGVGFFNIHKLYLLFEVLTLCVAVLFFKINSKVQFDIFSFIIIFFIILMNLIATIFVLKKKEKENINKVIKEGI